MSDSLKKAAEIREDEATQQAIQEGKVPQPKTIDCVAIPLEVKAQLLDFLFGTSRELYDLVKANNVGVKVTVNG